MKKLLSTLILLIITCAISWYLHDFQMEKDTFYVRRSQRTEGYRNASIEMDIPFKLTLSRETLQSQNEESRTTTKQQGAIFSLETQPIQIEDREVLKVFDSSFNFLTGNHHMMIKAESSPGGIIFSANGEVYTVKFATSEISDFPVRKTTYGRGFSFTLLKEENEPNEFHTITIKVD